MKRWQIIALIALVIVMAVLIWVFWGTMFSILLASCMILIPIVWLMNVLLNPDSASDWTNDGN